MQGRARVGRVSAAAAAGLFCVVGGAAAQAAAPDTAAIDVYLDCQNTFCDQNYFRTEIVFVNWVLDRAAADVHLLVTGQQAGGGGRQMTFAFLGLRRFANDNLELSYASAGDATQDDVRRAMAEQFKLGLVRYAARTAARDRLRVTYVVPAARPGAPAPGQAVSDPWNLWVFQIGMNGFANGESSTSFLNLNGNASANRVTQAWKISLGTNYNRQTQRYTLSDREVVSIRKSWGANGLAVKSLTAHWSAGARVTAGSVSTQNQDLYVTLSPGIEFNVYPYAESTRRSLTLQYLLTTSHFEWADTTLFGEIRETRPGHSATAAVQLNQPWGSVRFNVSANQYFHDFSKYGVQVGGNMQWRIFRGFSLNFGGNYARVHDQLFIPRGTLTDDQILTQQRQLATSYRYFTQFGVSYRFGSINNNTVNPRFGGDHGNQGNQGMMFF